MEANWGGTFPKAWIWVSHHLIRLLQPITGVGFWMVLATIVIIMGYVAGGGGQLGRCEPVGHDGRCAQPNRALTAWRAHRSSTPVMGPFISARATALQGEFEIAGLTTKQAIVAVRGPKAADRTFRNVDLDQITFTHAAWCAAASCSPCSSAGGASAFAASLLLPTCCHFSCSCSSHSCSDGLPTSAQPGLHV